MHIYIYIYIYIYFFFLVVLIKISLIKVVMKNYWSKLFAVSTPDVIIYKEIE